MSEREIRIYPGETIKIVCPPSPSALQAPVHANVSDRFGANTRSEAEKAWTKGGGRRTRKNRSRRS
jgi:hypothetical protein